MQQNDHQPLELNYNSNEHRLSLSQVITSLPADIEVYLIGGAVRNSLFRMFHNTVLTQRDYDQVITKGSTLYKEHLKSLAFKEHLYPSRQDEQVVYSLPLNEKARQGESYMNWLVLDLHTVDGTTIEENIRKNSAFTINGCAVNVRDLYSKPWKEAVIQVLPSALQDIKDKRLRLNYEGYRKYPSNFYAMLRFLSVGFSRPSHEEIMLLLKELPNLEHSRFERNVQKVWDYVGGEDKARALVKDLGIEIDVFNEEIVKSSNL